MVAFPMLHLAVFVSPNGGTGAPAQEVKRGAPASGQVYAPITSGMCLPLRQLHFARFLFEALPVACDRVNHSL